MEMRRRGFLLGAVARACTVLGGESVEQMPAHAVIAPPGTDNGKRLRTRCIGCNLCVAKCPTKVLKAATLEYGLTGTMMPVMDFSRGFCEKDCTVCGEVCPAGAIRPLSKVEKAKERIGLAALCAGWETKCLAFKDGHPCALCEKHCRYSAFKVLEEKTVGGKKTRRPAVDTSKCIGCGACAHCCPAHVIAITAKEGSLG